MIKYKNTFYLLLTFISIFYKKIEEQSYWQVKSEFDKKREEEIAKPSISIGDFDFNNVNQNNYIVMQIILLVRFKLINHHFQEEKRKNTFLHHLIVNENFLLERKNKLSLLCELHNIGQLKPLVDLQDIYGQTLAILTARIPNPQSAEVLRLLAAAGSDFTKQDQKGNTTLHHCAMLGSIENLEVITAGKSRTEVDALFSIINKEGKTVDAIIQENHELLSRNKELLQQKISAELNSIAVAAHRAKNAFGNFFRDSDFKIIFVSKKFSGTYKETAPIDGCCASMQDDPALILHLGCDMNIAGLVEKHELYLQDKSEAVFVNRHGQPIDREVFFNMKELFKTLDKESLLESCIKGVELCYQKFPPLQKVSLDTTATSASTQKYYRESNKSSYFSTATNSSCHIIRFIQDHDSSAEKIYEEAGIDIKPYKTTTRMSGLHGSSS